MGLVFCPRLHPQIPETVWMRRSPRNPSRAWRVCRVCKAIDTRLRHARRDLRNAEYDLDPRERRYRERLSLLEKQDAAIRALTGKEAAFAACKEVYAYLTNSGHDAEALLEDVRWPTCKPVRMTIRDRVG